MSATGRGAERKPEDFYPTPAWCVDRILDALMGLDSASGLPLDVLRLGARWLEPSAGDGAIIKAVARRIPGLAWTAVEKREECQETISQVMLYGAIDEAREGKSFVRSGAVYIADFLGPSMGWMGDTKLFDVAILNPPFMYAQEFIDRCKRAANIVIVLERLNFLASEERQQWLRDDPPDVYVLPNRPSFTGEGTDSIEYAWLVWPVARQREHGELRVLEPTPLEKRRVSKLVLPEGVGEPAQAALPFTGWDYEW